MNFTELQKRILTALFLLPATIFLILFNQIFFYLFLVLILIFSFYEWSQLNKKNFSFVVILGYFTILLSIFFAYMLRGNDYENAIVFLWIIFVCIFSDIGGFFFGKIIGGKKITKISPKKTYAGIYGSFIFSIFPIFILHFINYEFSISNILSLSWKYLILSILFSLICQCGDITVSYFKRKNKVKDTGKLFPGHGGLLDRIDGLIFVMIFSGLLRIFKVI